MKTMLSIAFGGEAMSLTSISAHASSKTGMICNSTPAVEADEQVILKTMTPGDVTNFPKMGDICTIHYEAFAEDEIRNNPVRPIPFDSSGCRDQVFQFRLFAGQVIGGMDIAVSKMSIGQKVEATIPYKLAYGIMGYPPFVPPRATLVFRIELVRFSSWD
jgi:FK506-binding protein 1